VRRFKFRHGGILRLRRHREDTVKGEMRTARDDHSREERARTRARRRRAEEARRISGGERMEFNIDDIVLGENYLAGLGVEIAHRSVRMAKIRERIAEIGVRLVAAMRERKIMEKLEERARASHRKEENKREQRDIDEVAGRARGAARGDAERKGAPS
jgi:flagellar export protein FliJ